ncbi:MAG: WG repeat-containing protein [Oscillospiraceae bacterium]|nr:WG repeat-containing protein [Oscillospiraceae bacterium]
MKRLFLLFLLLALLTACKAPAPAETTAPTDSSTTESTTEPTTEPTTETTTAPTETQAVHFEVNADFSQYTEQAPVQAKYTRLTDDPLEDLQPLDTPTRIYPFPGKHLVHPGGGRYYAEDQFRYGIVDETGCILADPVYSSVSLLMDQVSGKRLPYWLLNKGFPSTEDREAYDCYALASTDGTFVSDCIYSNITAYEGRIFAFYHNESEDRLSFDVYNTDLKLLLSSRNLPFADRLGGYSYDYTYAEGLYTIVFEERIYAPEGYYTREFSYYFMDDFGNLVLGPYEQAHMFCDGKAAVKLEDGYVFVDQNGSVITPKYESTHRLSTGNIIVCRETETDYIYELLSSDLELLTTLPGYSIEQGDGSILIFEDGDVCSCYSSDGKELWRRSGWNYLSAEIVYNRSSEPPVVENIPTGKTVSLPEDSHCALLGDPEDPIICISDYIYDCNYPVDYGSKYLDKELNRLPLSESLYLRVSYCEVGLPYRSAIAILDTDKVTVYTDAHTAVGSYGVRDCHMADILPDQVVSLTTAEYTYLYHPNGELILAYPINPMDD